MQINSTDPRLIVGIAVAAFFTMFVIALVIRERRRKTAGLRKHFGSEYDRTVLEHGSERRAQAELSDRQTRMEHLKIRELGVAERERFLAEWNSVQSRFLDHPRGAVIEADEVVSSLMLALGYPVADFNQRAADISVHHPRVVEYYRSAHAVAARLGNEDATTEDLRTAMIQYRTLFDELLQTQSSGAVQTVA